MRSLPNKIGKPVYIKHLSGVELLATVHSISHTTESLVIEKVRELHLQPQQTPQGVQMGLSIDKPFLTLYPDAQVTLENSSVLAIFEIPVDIEKAYIEQTSSIHIP
tara:strand:+ start:2888 stop:3205 length:318 start_codon:yes stop_codon:yes gene_type:complete